MPAEPKEPRTDAGKALVEQWGGDGGRANIALILAIEDQAATEARRELLAAVPEADTSSTQGGSFQWGHRAGWNAARKAVLRLIEESR